MNLSQAFVERYSSIVDDTDAFIEALQRPLKKSFRVNTLLSSASNTKQRFSSYGIPVEQVSWCSDAFVTASDALSTIEHALGMIYFQELTSMLPCIALQDELSSGRVVIDACAAPGSKTTHAACSMKNRGTIIANDVDYRRIRALKFNIEKSCAMNVVITNKDFLKFPEMQADVVLLDAPCSAEGMLRKKLGVLERWSLQRIAACAALQKKLMVKAFDLLGDDGIMLYSTCTFAPEENEAVIDFLLSQRDAKLEKTEIPRLNCSSGIAEWNRIVFQEEVKKCIRIWPHQNDTGGFFMAKIRKK